MSADLRPPPTPSWRPTLYEIIFEADTPAGRAFDVALIVCIVTSVVAVMLESVASIAAQYGPILRAAEWAFTVVFTVEYALRLACVGRPWRYARSFFGVVDLLAVAPTYMSVLVPGGQALLSVRALRLLRTFRVMKMAHHVKAAGIILEALRASRQKLTVFVTAVLTLVTVLGSAIYLVEGPEHGYTSIPRSVYWAIVTLTTVGYGDIAPQTTMGQALASIIMIIGYAIIAVPTGIVTVELTTAAHRLSVSGRTCGACSRGGHDGDARHCKYCGDRL